MRGYITFLKKEIIEAVKTYKLLVMGAVFLILGVMSPLIAKMTPDLIKWAMESDPSMAGMDLSGMITEPVALDSWMQFSGNITQMGLIALVVIFSGMLSSELSKGTLTIILTKGLSRSAVIMSKLTNAAAIWTVSLVAAYLTTWGYTAYLFPESVPSVYLMVFGIWVFGIFLLAMTTFFAAVTNKNFVCMVLVGAFAVVLNIINMLPGTDRFNPITTIQISSYITLFEGIAAPPQLYPSMIATGVYSVVLTTLAVFAFSKRRI